jgi:hypothetical protein
MSDETPAGCQHRDHKLETTCNKVCDPGQTLCPHHLMLSQECPPDGPTAERMRQASRPVKTPKGYTE